MVPLCHRVRNIAHTVLSPASPPTPASSLKWCICSSLYWNPHSLGSSGIKSDKFCLQYPIFPLRMGWMMLSKHSYDSEFHRPVCHYNSIWVQIKNLQLQNVGINFGAKHPEGLAQWERNDWFMLKSWFVAVYSSPYAARGGLQQDVNRIRMGMGRALFLMKCEHWAEFGRVSSLVLALCWQRRQAVETHRSSRQLDGLFFFFFLLFF